MTTEQKGGEGQNLDQISFHEEIMTLPSLPSKFICMRSWLK